MRWPVVDEDRVVRLLRRLREDTDALARAAQTDASGLVADETALDAVKYRFVVAIEGCTKLAHHWSASEGWSAPDSNAEAVAALGSHGVIEAQLADSIARAVGFRNLLVHRYAEVDDRRVVAMLSLIGDLQRFSTALADRLTG